MLRLRLAVTAALVAALPAVAPAQTPIGRLLAPFKKEHTVSPDAEPLLQKLKDGILPMSDRGKAALRERAQHLVFQVTDSEYYETTKPREPDTLFPRNPNRTVDKLVELTSKELIQNAEWAKLNENQRDYQRELGAALFDSALLVMTDKDPPQLLRVNAARLLVPAAESASPAVGRGLLKLLTGGVFKDEKKAPGPTPPDVLYYTLRACEAFLEKYDVPRPGVKDLTPDELGNLVGKLVEFVEKGPPILDKVAPVPSLDPKAQDAARVAVVRYYRLQAVRALAKARAETYSREKDTVHPAFTLARVAVGDPAIQPAPSTKEIGEAALGLLAAIPGPDTNAEELAYAAAFGTNKFFKARAEETPDMKLFDWKQVGLRFTAATTAWQTAAQKNVALSPAGKTAIAEAAAKLDRELYAAVTKPETALGNVPNVGEVDTWLSGRQGNLTGVLLNDVKDKNKYKLTYSK